FGPSAIFNGSNAAFQLNHAFDAAPNGVSFGRYIKSDGGADLVAMPVRTFGVDNPSSVPNFRTGTGLPNVYPKVGPIVISEIMYHPPDNGPFGTNDNSIDEFIELTSISGVTEPLYDPAYPTNTWSIDGAARFMFPMGATLPAGGRLLIVNFNPATNAAQLLAFRTLYGVSVNVPIFGPLAGKLDNSSESVLLYKPDTVQLPPKPDAGFVPQVLVEKVKYEDLPPWPTEPDGTGYSLHRLSLTGYSNDHTNWFAAPPTAGAGTASLVPVFSLEAMPNGSFKLIVVTTPGRSYMVEGSTNLAPNSWTTITNFTATSTNSAVTDNAILNLLQFRFYRAKGL
ncbi:MAG TPA: lamin tail domain-containing protein, partial [Pyrinomonadaceae bacterium]|nr:lamin tail domain-containing protein [Pyrinomonadaceae bacterium]